MLGSVVVTKIQLFLKWKNISGGGGGVKNWLEWKGWVLDLRWSVWTISRNLTHVTHCLAVAFPLQIKHQMAYFSYLCARVFKIAALRKACLVQSCYQKSCQLTHGHLKRNYILSLGVKLKHWKYILLWINSIKLIKVDSFLALKFFTKSHSKETIILGFYLVGPMK